MLHDACFLGLDVRGLSSALRRWLILISAVANQRQAVALLAPSLRQIGFHRMPSARSETIRVDRYLRPHIVDLLALNGLSVLTDICMNR